METRARKLRRIQQENILRTSRNKSLYFGVVPHDVLFHFVKHLSKWPHSEQWLDTVDDNDALTVLRIGGALSGVSGSMFNSLGYRPWLHSGFGFEKFDTLALVLAPHLDSLYVNSDRIRVFSWYNFSSLRVLRVDMLNVTLRVFRHALSSSGSSLVELTCKHGNLRKSDARNIARYCKSLRVLNLNDNSVHVISLKVIWEALGEKLTKFTGRIPVSDFPLVARHCTALNELKIANMAQLINENKQMVMESLQTLHSLNVLRISSYDDALLFMTVEEIEAFLQGRPSDFLLGLKCSLDSPEKFFDVMHTIGSRLRLFSLEFDFDTLPSETSFMLNNIQELQLLNCNDYNDLKLERLFTHSMPNLRKLTISVKNTSIFSHIARCTSNLLELTCELPFSDENPIPFLSVRASDVTQLLQENQKLHRVDVDFGFTPTFPSDDMILFVSCFNVREAIMHVVMRYYAGNELDNDKNLHSAALNELTAKGPDMNSEKYEKLRNTCVPLRTKQINLEFIRG